MDAACPSRDKVATAGDTPPVDARDARARKVLKGTTKEPVTPIMSLRRLELVAASPALRAWAISCPDSTFAGTARIETQHATYLFGNASCFAVSGRGARLGTTSSDLVGMRLAGWLLPDDDVSPDTLTRRQLDAGSIRVSRNWRPGSRAVLCGTGGPEGALRLALTSPVFHFTLYGDGAVEPGPAASAREPAVQTY